MIDYNNFHFKKLLTYPINKLINQIVLSVTILSPIKNTFYKRNVKYSIYDYAVGIIDVLKNNASWNSYNGIINGNTLRKKHNEWVKLNIYEHVYKNSLKKYLKTRRTEKLKYQSIDSTFIYDINGCKSSGYSHIYKKNKGVSAKGIKITSIVDTYGIPLSVTLDPANKYDSTLFDKAIDNLVIDCSTKKYQKHNRFKQYLLADKGYDSKNNINKSIMRGYNPLILQNKRNIKNKNLIRKLNSKQKKIYKKRTIIENYHAWIKKMPKIKTLNEKKIIYYKGLVLLGISIIINRRTL